MAYSKLNRIIRRVIVAIISIVILILSFYAVTSMQGFKNETEGKSNAETVKMAAKCPLSGITK